MNWESIALLFLGAFFVLCGVMAGGWLVFKSKAGPGEGFIRAPKGEAFTVREVDEVGQLFPEETNKAQENVLARTSQFLKTLGE